MLLLFPLACGGSERRPPVQNVVKLESISIAPAAISIVKGRGLTFSATGNYTDGTTKDLTMEVTWSSDNAAVATVGVNGVAYGVEAGTANIRAAKDTFSAEAILTVTGAPLVLVEVEPATATAIAGEVITLKAFGTLDDDMRLEMTSTLEWNSSDSLVATVSEGVVTTLIPGTVTIEARDAVTSISASATITVVEAQPVQLVVAPDSSNIPQGLTQQYSATAIYADQSTRDVTQDVVWSSTAQQIAVVSNVAGSKGLATTLDDGIASIEAHHVPSNLRAAGTLRVTPPVVARIDVTPSTPTIGQGDRVTFVAMATYTDGAMRDLSASVTWASSDQTVAILSTTDRATFLAIGAGMVEISATDPMSGVSSNASMSSAMLTVTPPALVSIAVVPMAERTPLGLNVQYQAFGVLSDRSSVDLTTTATWNSSAPGVASVDASGLVTPVGVGVTTISATDPMTGISSNDAGTSATLNVDPAQLLSIFIAPSARAMVTGTTQQFVATGRYSDGTQVNRSTEFSWRSTGPAVTVNAAGLASAQAVGTVTISAFDPATGISSDTTGESATVVVSNATLLSIAVVPTSTSVPPGAQVQLRAVGTYDNTATADMTALIDWTSSNPAVVDVGNATGTRGRANARVVGASTISVFDPISGVGSAASGGNLTFNVVADSLVSLSVTPRPSIININRATSYSASGLFASGQRYNLTNAVTWNSSNNSLATISNTEGTRGQATGVALGNVVISALHAASGISSNDSGQSSAAVVQLGQVTLTRTYPGPVVTIDSTVSFGISVGSLNIAAADVPPGAVITDVNVAITFLKTDGTCAVPGPDNPFHNETNFRIQGPSGQVVLVPAQSWTSLTVMPAPVTMTFDQSAGPIPLAQPPMTGSFQPLTGNLDTFNGTSPVGNWVLQAGDAAGGDPLCIHAYTVTVVAQ